MKRQSDILTKIIIYLKTSKDYQYKEDALKYLNNKKNNLFDDELFAKIMTIIIDNNINFNEAITRINSST